MTNEQRLHLRGIILDTAIDSAPCDFCRGEISREEPQVIIGLRKNGIQWFKFLHQECAEQTQIWRLQHL
jgi:hypothetical protein